MIANFIESLIDATAWTFLHFLWQGLLVGAVMAVVLRTARNRYAAAAVALAVLWVLAGVTFAWQFASPAMTVNVAQVEQPAEVVPTNPAPASTGSIEPNPTASAAPIGEDSSTTIAAPVNIEASQTSAAEVWPPLAVLAFYWRPVVAGLWIIGATLCALRLCNDWRAVQKLRSHAQPLAEDSPWRHRFQALLQRMNLTRPIQFLTSDSLTTPIVMGVFQPVVIFPLSLLSQMPSAQVEAILLHELAHIRRHDYLVNILQRVTETVFFFQPVVWYVSHRMRVERELCCDDIASASCDTVSQYAGALAALEAFRSAENYELAAAAKGSSEGSLLSRIRRLAGGNSTDHIGIDWRLPAAMLACCTLAMMTFAAFWAIGADEDAIDIRDLHTTSYSLVEKTVFCVHTDEELFTVLIIEEPSGVTSTSLSSGVQASQTGAGSLAWAKMKWNDHKLDLQFFTNQADRIHLNGKPYYLKGGRALAWNAETAVVAYQADQLKEKLPAYKPQKETDLTATIRALHKQIEATFPVKMDDDDLPAEREEPAPPSATPAAAEPAKPTDHNVTVFGKVVDDETGELIEQGVIVQGGRFDPSDPAKGATFGYTRTSGGQKTGKFSTTVNFPQGRTARVLVDGYYPMPVVATAPEAGVKRLEVTLRLKKLRTVSGRVLNHLKEPVAGAKVFSVKSVSIIYSGGDSFNSFDSKDEHSVSKTTDEAGRFSGVPVTEMNAIVISDKSFDAWPVQVAEDKTEVVVELPKPSQVTIDFDIEGEGDEAELFYQYLSPFYEKRPEWKNVAIERRIKIKKGKTTLNALPFGSYQISRQRVANMGVVGRYLFIERQFFVVGEGETHHIDWTRKTGARVKAKVTWPEEVEVAGLMYTILGKPNIDMQGDESPNILDGAGINVENGEIHTTLLPPGKYTLEIAVQKPIPEERLRFSGIIVPDHHRRIELVIPDDRKEIVLEDIKLEL